MKRFLPLVVVAVSIVVASVGCGPMQPVSPPPTPWLSGVEGFQALQNSGKSSRPLLLAFLKSGCEPCKSLARRVLYDETFIKNTEGIELLAIDLAKGKEEKLLARKFRVMSTPTLFLIVPDKKIVKKIELRQRQNNRLLYPQPIEAAEYLKELVESVQSKG
jgi:thiol-disulfide isomerase/thioredoxin